MEQRAVATSTWRAALTNLTIVSQDGPVRLGVRPVHPSKFVLDDDEAKKIEATRRKELNLLRELDFAEWSSRQSRDDTERQLDVDSGRSTAHDYIASAWNGDEYLISVADGDDEIESEVAGEDAKILDREAFLAWLELRQVDWAARRRAKKSDELAESPKTAPAES